MLNKKFLFVALFLVAILVISGCSMQNIQKSPGSRQLVKPGTGGTRDHYAPVIKSFSVSNPYNCRFAPRGDNDTLLVYTCSVAYTVHATDDIGVVSFSYNLVGPSSGIGGGYNFPATGDFWNNGTFDGLEGPANYSLTVTVTDGKGKEASKTKIFSIPSWITETHLECINNTCTEVDGAGSNQCAPAGSTCGLGGNTTNQTGWNTTNQTNGT
jgi:hypothetical protein